MCTLVTPADTYATHFPEGVDRKRQNRWEQTHQNLLFLLGFGCVRSSQKEQSRAPVNIRNKYLSLPGGAVRCGAWKFLAALHLPLVAAAAAHTRFIVSFEYSRGK